MPADRTLTRLCIVRGTSLVLDPLENLFPVDRDILWRIYPETNLRSIYTKNGHDDVGTDPDDLSNSPRKY
jgi:hypothetical protein